MNIPVDIVLVVSLPPTHHHRACELFAHRHHHLILVVLTNLIHGPYALHGPDKQDTVSILDRRVQSVGEEKHFVAHGSKFSSVTLKNEISFCSKKKLKDRTTKVDLENPFSARTLA